MTPVLEAIELTKQFPGVRALDRVSLQVWPGEVVAVIGENGAGKSTLMKMLGGIYQPDGGTIQIDGQAAKISNVAEALRLGISLIHQELNLADNLSVAANLFLGRENWWGGWLRLLQTRTMEREARVLMDRVGLDCSPQSLVGRLSPGQRQLVEIARALALRVRVLIMDEPTSSLSQKETDRLFEVVEDLKQSGVAIVYISHRLVEVQQIADRIVVLRDGKNAGKLDRQAGITHDAMVRLMVGRDLKQFFQKQPHIREDAPPRLAVREFRYEEGPTSPVSFDIRRGEIVGMAGLVGAGRTELAEALFGLRRPVAGDIRLDGQPVRLRNPRQAVGAGLLLVPEDRRHHGLLLESSVLHNLSLPNLDILNVLRFVARRKERKLATELCSRLQVRTPSIHRTVALLSGGNQQKVVLGKWLARQPRVLILDEPTRGVDVGAKSEIYSLMDQLAGQGVGILMISSDLEEILNMSDRVLVLHEGRIAGGLDRSRLNEETIMRLATGGAA